MKKIIVIDGNTYVLCQTHNIYFPSRYTQEMEKQKNEALIERGVFITDMVACPMCTLKTRVKNLFILLKQTEENERAIVHKNNPT